MQYFVFEVKRQKDETLHFPCFADRITYPYLCPAQFAGQPIHGIPQAVGNLAPRKDIPKYR